MNGPYWKYITSADKFLIIISKKGWVFIPKRCHKALDHNNDSAHFVYNAVVYPGKFFDGLYFISSRHFPPDVNARGTWLYPSYGLSLTASESTVFPTERLLDTKTKKATHTILNWTQPQVSRELYWEKNILFPWSILIFFLNVAWLRSSRNMTSI